MHFYCMGQILSCIWHILEHSHVTEKATAVELKKPSSYYSPVSLLFAQKSDNCIFDWNGALSHFLAERHPSVRLKRPANSIGNYRLLTDTHPLLCIFRVCQVKQRQIHTYFLFLRQYKRYTLLRQQLRYSCNSVQAFGKWASCRYGQHGVC